MKKTKRDYVARLVVYGLDDGAFDIDRLKEWLINQSVFFNDKEPADFGKVFTARLMK